MSDGKERPGLYDALAASWVKPISSDPRDSGEIGYDIGYEIGKREGAHASLAQQAAFAQACAPRGDDPRPGMMELARKYNWPDPLPERHVLREMYDIGRAQGRQETLLACAEERVLAAGQPMSGEVRRELESLLAQDYSFEHTGYGIWEIKQSLRRILAMGTRTDVEAGT